MNCPVCQSCGMPLHEPAVLGTDEKGIPIEEYCLYCYKDGKFTSDVTMEEMIQLCAKYVQNVPKEKAVFDMRMQFPKLKRWAQKEQTQNEYHKSINKVLDYINEHLDESPDLETLSDIANISAYHFHRIFKGIIGENLGEYVQRLRLEYVAGKLRTTDMTLDSLADKTGYNSKQALSRAFKKYFGVPPSIYKNTPGSWQVYAPVVLTPRICKIAPRNILYVRVIDEYGATDSYNEVWKQLYMYAILNKIYTDKSESLGISFDDPSVTETQKCRFYACISTDKLAKPKGKFGSSVIDGGLYAIFTHKGSYKGLHDLYKNIWFQWLPSSKYRIRKGVFFEKYLNNPSQVKEENILTEVYIPVSLRK